MKTPAMKTIAIAAAALTASMLAITPAQAEDLRVQVDYADLDITSTEGAAALASRIEAGVSKACARSSDFRSLKAAAQCEDALLSEAADQLASREATLAAANLAAQN